ncbi:hypothetical protein GEMRC1_001690 [Eukaryota sp. GEM-RC1]
MNHLFQLWLGLSSAVDQVLDDSSPISLAKLLHDDQLDSITDEIINNVLHSCRDLPLIALMSRIASLMDILSSPSSHILTRVFDRQISWTLNLIQPLLTKTSTSALSVFVSTTFPTFLPTFSFSSLTTLQNEPSIFALSDSLKSAALSHDSSLAYEILAIVASTYLPHFTETATSPHVNKLLNSLYLIISTFFSRSLTCPGVLGTVLFSQLLVLCSSAVFAEFFSLFLQHFSLLHTKHLQNPESQSINFSINFRTYFLDKVLSEVSYRWIHMYEAELLIIFDSTANLLNSIAMSPALRSLCNRDEFPGSWLEAWVTGSQFVVDGSSLCSALLAKSFCKKQVFDQCVEILLKFEKYDESIVKFALVVVAVFRVVVKQINYVEFFKTFLKKFGSSGFCFLCRLMSRYPHFSSFFPALFSVKEGTKLYFSFYSLLVKNMDFVAQDKSLVKETAKILENVLGNSAIDLFISLFSVYPSKFYYFLNVLSPYLFEIFVKNLNFTSSAFVSVTNSCPLILTLLQNLEILNSNLSLPQTNCSIQVRYLMLISSYTDSFLYTFLDRHTSLAITPLIVISFLKSTDCSELEKVLHHLINVGNHDVLVSLYLILSFPDSLLWFGLDKDDNVDDVLLSKFHIDSEQFLLNNLEKFNYFIMNDLPSFKRVFLLFSFVVFVIQFRTLGYRNIIVSDYLFALTFNSFLLSNLVMMMSVGQSETILSFYHEHVRC